MRLLWCSNFSSQSAYALQARLFVPRIQQAGHDVSVLELANGTRMPQMIGDVRVLPVALDPLGSDSITQHVAHQRSHAVVTLVDAWGLNAQIMRQVPWYPWTPIDTMPAAPAVVDTLKAARRPIAMTQYGVSELRKAGFDPLYVPHAVDPAVWYPRDKQQARAALGIDPDVFFVAFVGVNDTTPSRKGIPELLMAWQLFAPQHPDARLYLHTALHGNLPINSIGGVKINEIVKALQLDDDKIHIVEEYRYRTGIPTAEMATLAAAADVLVLPTRGEGFGLPLIEFQRVGTPVITTDFAGGAELCFSGWLLEGEPEWGMQHAFVMKPGIASIAEALDAAYQERGNPLRRQRAIEGARAYDVDHVMSRYMLPALQTIAEHALDTMHFDKRAV